MKSRFSIVSGLLILIWALSSHGCAWWTQIDANRDASFARIDHRDCTRRGYTWPSKAYTDCRRFQADDRRREQWMELQMARQQQQPQVGIRPQSPLESYRPIDEDGFRCFEATDDGGDTYIDCEERP